jgi:hypothetical protein
MNNTLFLKLINYINSTQQKEKRKEILIIERKAKGSN